jgi:hypothetical protein
VIDCVGCMRSSVRRLRFPFQMQLRLAPASLAWQPHEKGCVLGGILGVVELLRRIVVP